MAIKPIYLEPDEEIISLIDKISALSDHSIAVVIPKNSALFKSLINLKLLAKEAKEHDKEIIVISSDKIGQRLAAQVGLKTYANIHSIPVSLGKNEKPIIETVVPNLDGQVDEIVDGVKVHRYQGPSINDMSTELAETDIIPAETEAPTDDNLEKSHILNPEIGKEESLNKGSDFESKEIDTTDNESDRRLEEEAIPKDKEELDKVDSSTVRQEELPAIISRNKPSRDRIKLRIPWLAIGIASTIIIIIALLVFLFLPRASVTITFPAKPLDQTLTLDVTTAGNHQGLTITGTEITSDKTVTEMISSSGTADIGTKATGNVTITNEYKSSSGVGESETLPAGTVITYVSSGQTFTLDNTVTIGSLTYNSNTGQPIYQSQNDGVTAVSPGTAGNIAATTFSSSAALSNTVIQSSSAFSGGVSNIVKILTQSDVNNAIASLKSQAAAQTLADLQNQAGSNTLLTGSTWQISQSQSVNHNVGDQTDTATATYELKIGAIVYSPSIVLNAIKGSLSTNISPNQQLILQSSDVTNTFSSLNDSETSMSVSSKVQAHTIVDIDQSKLISSIAGKSTSAMASTLIGDYGATSATVKIEPSWWPGRLPLLDKFITVKFTFEQEK